MMRIFRLGALSLLALTSLASARAAAPPAVKYEPSLLVELKVKDLDRSIRFYQDTLGFKVTERRDDLQFVHIDCGIHGLQLGLSSGGTTPPNPGTIYLNFGVEGDVEAARKSLEAKGVVFGGPTLIIPGKVRLADFKDPDGYRIRLAGDDVPAR
jgi:catechol 2,3-dioxygenase-like lactoylglutathione lyase family enzyme